MLTGNQYARETPQILSPPKHFWGGVSFLLMMSNGEIRGGGFASNDIFHSYYTEINVLQRHYNSSDIGVTGREKLMGR